MTATAVVVIAGWCVGWLMWGRPKPLTGGRPPLAGRPRTGRVAVVIPARNEARNLPPLLETLVGVEPRRTGQIPTRVLVVDDGSVDDTARLAGAFPGVEVLAAGDPPPGWTGKTWACARGVAALDGWDGHDALVFVDADVTFSPGGLQALLAELGARSGAVSVQPRHRVPTWVEQLSLFPSIVATMGIGAGRRRRSTDGLFGPVIACSLADYTASGGHAAVRHEVIEDVELGRRFRQTGLPTAVLQGGALVSYRMYPDGLGQLVEGWSKNLALGAGRGSRWRTAAIALWITGVASAPIALVQTRHVHPMTLLLAVVVLASIGQVAWFARSIGTYRSSAWVGYPLGIAALTALLAWSAVLTLVVGRVTWRDRTIRTRPGPTHDGLHT